MINKNIMNMMLAVMMTVGLVGCSVEDNPVNPDFSSAVLGQWYSEDNAPGSFDAHGIDITNQLTKI